MTTMSSPVNIIFSLDGSNIKDDVVKRVKEGSDGIGDIRTCSLADHIGVESPENTGIESADVNVLIITPSMAGEISKNADKDFSLVFPDVEKSLLLVCDIGSEKKVSGVISKTVEYTKITQFHNSNAMEWKFMMVPTIKKLASHEKEETVIPDINRYVIRPKQIDSCADEVSVIFLENTDQYHDVRVAVDDRTVGTTELAKGVYEFCPKELCPGLHTVTVQVGEEKYGSTTLEVKSDVEKLQEIFHKTLQTDTMTLLSRLLGCHTEDKEDIEREMIDILSEKPNNPAFLNLMERLLRLEPNDGRTTSEEHDDFLYPSLLHFCADSGFSSVCQWLLHNTADDKRSWTNKEGLTPAQLAARRNYEQLQELLDPTKPIAGPPLGRRESLNDDEPVFLPSPVSPGYGFHRSWELPGKPNEDRRRSLSTSDRPNDLLWQGLRRPSVPLDPGRDSGQFSCDGSGGGSAASVRPPRRQSADNTNGKSSFPRKERLYDTIDDGSETKPNLRKSAPLPSTKFSFKKKEHFYNEIDDVNPETTVQLRPEKEPHYDEAWDKNPVPDIPFKPASGQRRRESDITSLPRTATFPQGTARKTASLPRGKSFDNSSSGTYL